MKILLILLLSFSAFSIEITPVKKGETISRDGFFIDAKNMKELRQINEEKKNLEKQKLKLEQLGVIRESQLNIQRSDVLYLQKKVRKARSMGDLKGIGGFVLGVFGASLAAYAAIKVVWHAIRLGCIPYYLAFKTCLASYQIG